MGILKAIFFDMDGVIVDTEKDGHRVAFNEAFKQSGINVEWGISKYHSLLQIAGGKERMISFFKNEGKKYLPPGNTLENYVQQLHKLKTEIFISLIGDGRLPLRPGIKRLMQEANEMEIKVGICTTSNEKAVMTILKTLLSDIKTEFVLAGDIVKLKKPDPEIYLMALEKAGLKKNEVIVIEDSENGLIAAQKAGLKVLVTLNEYTKNEKLQGADVILSGLGDEQEKTQVITGDFILSDCQMVHLEDLMKFFQHSDSENPDNSVLFRL